VSIFPIIIVGFVAGWIVGKLTRGRGYGLLGNIAIGLIGSWVGSFVFGFTGLEVNTQVGEVILSVVGALTLLFLFSLFRSGPKRKRKDSDDEDDE
jgi:uncharacterized membrane protein YeaQ/YmgE (transglycosylase-associated protein family)